MARQSCSAFATGARKGGPQVSMGMRRGKSGRAELVPRDWEVTGFLGFGAAFGAGCGVGFNLPKFPR